jgi:AcrR family transcriptional regulator
MSSELINDRQKIISSARNVFLETGFQKTTVDEIALHAGVGKNKIYKLFPSKDKIIEEVIMFTADEINGKIQIILNENSNAIQKFFNLLNCAADIIMKYHDRFLMNLQNYSSKLRQKVEEIRVKYMNRNLSRLIEQGKKEGLFIDYPNEIIISVLIGVIRTSTNPRFIASNNFSLNDSLKFSLEIILNGILTPKGKKFLKKLKIL